MPLNKVAIVGVGLIGGSLAAAWRETGFAKQIVGVEADPQAAELALELGLVDEILAQVPGDVELIAVCTPSDVVAEHVRALAKLQVPMFDVGSVKAPILDDLSASGGIPALFVPSHPIAGSELSGPAAASAQLFKGATTVMTPLAHTDDDAIKLVELAWLATGSVITQLSPHAHDEMLAVTSHLPHLLAYVFMQQVDSEQLKFSGGGFRDFTRIAGANPELWWRILRMNEQQVVLAADTFSRQLEAFTQALLDDDESRGLESLRAAASLREQLDD
jgi:3-phosphoshikimate 1-carboxyvinyltransferase